MYGVMPLPSLRSLPSVRKKRATTAPTTLAPALHRHLIYEIPSHWQLPETDIHSCITVSRVRRVLSLVSLLLLLTDIPRTGLGVRDVFQLFPSKAGPNVAVFFGPWAYPVAHIWRNDTSSSNDSLDSTSTLTSNASAASFSALKGANPIKAATVWSYEYDSTSIGLRGISQLLNVTKLPQPSHATTAPLALKNAYTNLDALISAIHRYVSSDDKTSDTVTKSLDLGLLGHFKVATVNIWVDRLHHYLYRWMRTTTRWRLHAVHAYTKTTVDPTEALSICAPTRRHRPVFCDMAVKWLCKHPIDATLPKVAIWDHVDLHTAALQHKYPTLKLDLTILTTFNPTTSTTTGLSAYFETEVLEIVTLIRGQRCSSAATANNNADTPSASSCTTVFVDDYRYERGVIDANMAEWYPFTATLRAVAQTYVWVRIALLLYVAYNSERCDGSTSRGTRFANALRLMSKIPFQVVVYGSLLPVLAYVLAHVIDCSFVDLYLEMYWTTIDGSLRLDVRTFARHAAMQMRNVWILALAIKTLVFVETRVLGTWRPACGVRGVRGLAISLSSMLSVVGPFRSLAFRDSSVVSVLALATTSSFGGHALESVKARPVSLFNVSVEGLPKDMKMTALAVGVVLCAALTARVLLRLLRPRYVGGVAFGHSTLVPYSAGMLWPATALSVQFSVSLASGRLVVPASTRRAVSPVRIAPASATVSPTKQSIATTAANTTLVQRVLQSAAQLAMFTCYACVGIDRAAEAQFAAEHRTMHDVALRLDERSVELNSLVQLMNVAMMTDPWTLFCLRVLGRQVFFYEPTAQREPSLPLHPTAPSAVAPAAASAMDPLPPTRVVVLPCSPDELLEWTGYCADELRLVGQMSSRDLPWTVLLQCG